MQFRGSEQRHSRSRLMWEAASADTPPAGWLSAPCATTNLVRHWPLKPQAWGHSTASEGTIIRDRCQEVRCSHLSIGGGRISSSNDGGHLREQRSHGMYRCAHMSAGHSIDC